MLFIKVSVEMIKVCVRQRGIMGGAAGRTSPRTKLSFVFQFGLRPPAGRSEGTDHSVFWRGLFSPHSKHETPLAALHASHMLSWFDRRHKTFCSFCDITVSLTVSTSPTHTRKRSCVTTHTHINHKSPRR